MLVGLLVLSDLKKFSELYLVYIFPSRSPSQIASCAAAIFALLSDSPAMTTCSVRFYHRPQNCAQTSTSASNWSRFVGSNHEGATSAHEYDKKGETTIVESYCSTGIWKNMTSNDVSTCQKYKWSWSFTVLANRRRSSITGRGTSECDCYWVTKNSRCAGSCLDLHQ